MRNAKETRILSYKLSPMEIMLAAMSGSPLPEPPQAKSAPAPAGIPSQAGMPQTVVVVRRDAMGRMWAVIARKP